MKVRYEKALFVGIVIFYFAINTFAFAKEHPSLLFSESDIPEILYRIEEGTPKEAWDILINQCDNFMNHNPNYAYDFGRACEQLSFAYQINGNEEYGNRAIELCLMDKWWNFKFETGNSLRWADCTHGFIFVYDYCYDLIENQGLESAFRSKLEELIDSLVSKEARWYGSGNISAFLASAWGLAAIVIDGETSYPTKEKIDYATSRVQSYLELMLSNESVCHEACSYAVFALHPTLPFLDALIRYNNKNLYNIPHLKNWASWYVYEILPWPSSHNTRNDCHAEIYYTNVFSSLAATYQDPLAQYLFHHYGIRHTTWRCFQLTSFILKHDDNLEPINDPAEILPLSRYFDEARLIYFRNGWQDGAIVFHLDLSWCFDRETQKYLAGHDQSDKNCFTLYAYGEKFAIDPGYSSVVEESLWATKSHNGILIDGKGEAQAYGGYCINGYIPDYLLGEFCEYVHGDAECAYDTFWSWKNGGTPYEGENPVENADRYVTFVKEKTTPPYFVIADDIKKDSETHVYSWLFHTELGNSFEILENMVSLHGKREENELQIHVISPLIYEASVSYEENPRLSINTNAINPYYFTILFPYKQDIEIPEISRIYTVDGVCAQIKWSTVVDYVCFKKIENFHEYFIETDAKLSLVREDKYYKVSRYLMAEGTYLTWHLSPLVNSYGDSMTVINAGIKVFVSSKVPDIKFQLYAPKAQELWLNDKRVSFSKDGDYIYYPLNPYGKPNSHNPGPCYYIWIDNEKTCHIFWRNTLYRHKFQGYISFEKKEGDDYQLYNIEDIDFENCDSWKYYTDDWLEEIKFIGYERDGLGGFGIPKPYDPHCPISGEDGIQFQIMSNQFSGNRDVWFELFLNEGQQCDPGTIFIGEDGVHPHSNLFFITVPVKKESGGEP